MHYWAFISYRHADNKEPGRQWATWLHQMLETYEVPKDLVGTTNLRGEEIPERIFPVFRDEEELPADADLASPIYHALDESRFLVVICSPRAVESLYVHNEIAYFKKLGRADRVLAAMIDGEPNTSLDEAKKSDLNSPQECFPVAVQYQVDTKGELTNERAEPIAADFRFTDPAMGDSSQGWTSPTALRQALQDRGDLSDQEISEATKNYEAQLELMKLKIIAGILGVKLGDLTKRDQAYQLELQRKRASTLRNWLYAVGLLLVLAVGAEVLAFFQWQEAQEQTTIAQENEKTAKENEKKATDALKEAQTQRNRAEAGEKLAKTNEDKAIKQLADSYNRLAAEAGQKGDYAYASAYLAKSLRIQPQDNPASTALLCLLTFNPWLIPELSYTDKKLSYTTLGHRYIPNLSSLKFINNNRVVFHGEYNYSSRKLDVYSVDLIKNSISLFRKKTNRDPSSDLIKNLNNISIVNPIPSNQFLDPLIEQQDKLTRSIDQYHAPYFAFLASLGHKLYVGRLRKNIQHAMPLLFQKITHYSICDISISPNRRFLATFAQQPIGHSMNSIEEVQGHLRIYRLVNFHSNPIQLPQKKQATHNQLKVPTWIPKATRDQIDSFYWSKTRDRIYLVTREHARDAEAELWNVKQKKLIQRYPNIVFSELSPDAQHVLQFEWKKQRASFLRMKDGIAINHTPVTFHPFPLVETFVPTKDRRYLFTGISDYDGTLNYDRASIWSLETGKLIKRWHLPDNQPLLDDIEEYGVYSFQKDKLSLYQLMNRQSSNNWIAHSLPGHIFAFIDAQTGGVSCFVPAQNFLNILSTEGIFQDNSDRTPLSVPVVVSV